MANNKSAEKRVIRTAKETRRNRRIKGDLKANIKQYNTYISSKELKKAEEMQTKIISMIDSACSKGVMHKNAAARTKSRVVSRLQKAAG